MSFSNPLVSIVIPVFNGSNFLRDAIDSALAQTYPNFEILVVNDGSSDNGKTEEVALSYGDRIRYFHQPNRGVSAALNTGIREMKGEYFAWLSHDDVFLPRKLELQVRALETEGADVVVYSDYELVDTRLRRIKKKIMGDVAPEQFRFRILLDTGLHGCTILIPRVCFEKGGFDEALRTTQDYDMWFRLAETCRFVRVPEILLQNRIHSRQESWTNVRIVSEANELYRGFLDALSPSEIERASGRPAPTVYAEAAVRFKLRGFFAAAEYALGLGRRCARSWAQRLAPRRLALLALYRVAHPNMRPMVLWKRLHFRANRLNAEAPSGGGG